MVKLSLGLKDVMPVFVNDVVNHRADEHTGLPVGFEAIVDVNADVVGDALPLLLTLIPHIL